MTAAGISFVAGRALTLAVTGAEADLRVDGRARPWGEPVSVPSGAEVVVGPARVGVRSYLAVGGGVVGEADEGPVEIEKERIGARIEKRWNSHGIT